MVVARFALAPLARLTPEVSGIDFYPKRPSQNCCATFDSPYFHLSVTIVLQIKKTNLIITIRHEEKIYHNSELYFKLWDRLKVNRYEV